MAVKNAITRTFETSVAAVLFQPLSFRAAPETPEQGRIISTECIGVMVAGLGNRRNQSGNGSFLEEFAAA